MYAVGDEIKRGTFPKAISNNVLAMEAAFGTRRLTTEVKFNDDESKSGTWFLSAPS